MRNIRYTIQNIEQCNMCRADKDKFIVLGKRLNRSQGRSPHKKIGITTTVCKCSVCGLIFANPLPIPADINDHYGVVPEAYWKPEYFEVTDNYFREEIKWLKKLVPTTNGMKSLDIGAGIGKQMIALQKIGFDTFGIEPSKPFYERAVNKMKISPEKIRLSSIEEANFEKGFFDFISFGAVLEHLYDPSDTLHKALQWLKPNGLIHIEVPHSKWLINKLVNTYYKLKGLDYVANISPMHSPFHLFEFSIKSFEENAKINKYKIKVHYYYVCQTYLPGIFDVILKPLMAKTNTGMQLAVWIQKL